MLSGSRLRRWPAHEPGGSEEVNELAVELLGMAGALADDDGFPRAFLFAQALTIGGGTTEVQKNILALRVLGLPRP